MLTLILLGYALLILFSVVNMDPPRRCYGCRAWTVGRTLYCHRCIGGPNHVR